MNIDVRPGQISIAPTIRRPLDPFFADRSGTVDYIIELPQTCELASVRLDTGEVLIEGMRGSGIHAKLDNGRLFVRNCFANTEFVSG